MSYSDSNATQRFKGMGRALKDFKVYTTNQGKQACNAMKGRELISTLKQSTQRLPTFSLKKNNNRVRMGNMKHTSLCEFEDESIVLWSDTNEEDSHIPSSSQNKLHSDTFAKKNLVTPIPIANHWNSLQGTEFAFISSQNHYNPSSLPPFLKKVK